MKQSNARGIGLFITGIGFAIAGSLHFVKPDAYARIVPPGFPLPRLLVAISGVAEIVGGIGLLVPWLRRAAGCGLILLLIAVFPANLYMALTPTRFSFVPPWLLWARLPLQVVIIVWVWWVAIRRTPPKRKTD